MRVVTGEERQSADAPAAGLIGTRMDRVPRARACAAASCAAASCASLRTTHPTEYVPSWQSRTDVVTAPGPRMETTNGSPPS